MTKNNSIKIIIDPSLYPLEAVYGAAYIFLDRAYVKLDGDPKKQIIVSLKGKSNLNQKLTKNLKDEFLNELLECGLRMQISKKNKRIREYIVGTAIFGSSGEESTENEDEKEDWQADAMGIAVPWEEKYNK